MDHKEKQVIEAALKWYEAYEKYSKTSTDKYDFNLFASQIKLFIAIRDYKGK